MGNAPRLERFKTAAIQKKPASTDDDMKHVTVRISPKKDGNTTQINK